MNRHELLSATPQQIETYIENNVNNMADVKAVLKLYGKMIAFGARKR